MGGATRSGGDDPLGRRRRKTRHGGFCLIPGARGPPDPATVTSPPPSSTPTNYPDRPSYS